jgi:hypothetical protein
MISPEEAARLAALAAQYDRLDAAHLASLYRSLLWHEQRKDELARAGEDYAGEFGTVQWFNEQIRLERRKVIQEWGRTDAELLGTYYRNTAQGVDVLLTQGASESQIERKIWEFETALADDSAERVLAIQEAQWRSSVAAFGVHIAAMANAALGFQRPTEVPGPGAATRTSAFRPPPNAITQGFKTGDAARDFHAASIGAQRVEVTIETAIGRGATRFRRIDTLKDGVAHEVKMGYQGFTSKMETQIKKDAWLVQNARRSGVREVQWHFYRSQETGRVGADPRLLEALDKAGIKYVIHGQ